MSVMEARQICPSITICSVPISESIRKADLTRYRTASEEVFKILNSYNKIVVEKASIDEAYLDVSLMIDDELKSFVDETNSNEKYSKIIQNVIKKILLIY